MKKILIFSSLYLPHLGGVERYTSNLAKHLVMLGNEVTVATSQFLGEGREENIDSVRVVRLKSFSFLDGRFPIYDLRYVKKYKDTLRKTKYDLVIINTRYYPLSLFGAKYAYKENIKCILIDHSTGHISFDNFIIDACSSIYEHFITSRMKKYPIDFYGVSKNSSRWLNHFNVKSKGEIYNAVDLDAIEEIKKDDSNKFPKIPFGNYSTVICFTGRLIKEKGILELILGFCKFKEDHNSCLIIAGDGPLLEELQQKNIDDIFLLGKISFEKVVSLLCRSDVFCFPTAYPEGFPTSLLEAAACRCYLISTDRGGASELIRNKNYGYILDNNSPETIAQSLKDFINIDNLDEILDNAYNEVMTHYDWKVIANKVADIN